MRRKGTRTASTHRSEPIERREMCTTGCFSPCELAELVEPERRAALQLVELVVHERACWSV